MRLLYEGGYNEARIDVQRSDSITIYYVGTKWNKFTGECPRADNEHYVARLVNRRTCSHSLSIRDISIWILTRFCLFVSSLSTAANYRSFVLSSRVITGTREQTICIVSDTSTRGTVTLTSEFLNQYGWVLVCIYACMRVCVRLIHGDNNFNSFRSKRAVFNTRELSSVNNRSSWPIVGSDSTETLLSYFISTRHKTETPVFTL